MTAKGDNNDKDRGDVPYQSTLERHPEHVKAIGMIAIEMGNLEVILARLFGALLDIDQVLADAIFYTPQATGPRIALVANLADEILQGKALKDVKKLLKTARELQGRRNDHLHNSWGLSASTGKVISSKPPKGDEKPITLQELTSHVLRLRRLITTINEITPHVHAFAWGSTSRGKLLERVRLLESQIHKSPTRSSKNPKHRVRRKSSQT